MTSNTVDLSLYGIYDHADQELVLRFLRARDITTPSQVEQVFNPSVDDEHDMMLADSAQLWMAKLYEAQRTNIVIVGDYDADGVMASTVAYKGLSYLNIGKTLKQYVPIREDGYGLSKKSVDKILTQFPDVETLITVDNGVVAYEGIDYAKAHGLTVLVTDHHLGKDEIANADAIVDINQAFDHYPFKGLSGTAVIWKLLLCYAKVASTPIVVNKINQLIDYVGVSTITDIMPLIDENRYFVKQALHSLNNRLRLHWSVLFDLLDEKNKLYGTEVNEEFIGYTLGPMINAAGRVTGSPDLAYRFFRSEDLNELRTLAQELFDTNERRKEEVKSFASLAEDSYDGEIPDGIMIGLPLKIGYAGLVASNLTQRFDRPAVVMSGRNGVVHGSARSPIWFNIVEAFQTIYDAGLIVQFGGHAGAAGLEIEAKNIPDAQMMLSQLVVNTLAHMTPDEKKQSVSFVPDLTLHIESNFARESRVATDVGFAGKDDLVQVSELFERLRPFGQQFSAPIIKIQQVDFPHARRMGANKQHAKVDFGGLSVIAWNVPEAFDTTKSIVGQLSVNEFRGNLTPQVIVDKFID